MESRKNACWLCTSVNALLSNEEILFLARVQGSSTMGQTYLTDERLTFVLGRFLELQPLRWLIVSNDSPQVIECHPLAPE